MQYPPNPDSSTAPAPPASSVTGDESSRVEVCDTSYVRPGDISHEAGPDGNLDCFYIYGEGQRIRLSLRDAHVMSAVLVQTLEMADDGTYRMVYDRTDGRLINGGDQ